MWTSQASDQKKCVVCLFNPLNCKQELLRRYSFMDESIPVLCITDHLTALGWRPLDRAVRHTLQEDGSHALAYDGRNLHRQREYAQVLLVFPAMLDRNGLVSSVQPQSYFQLLLRSQVFMRYPTH